MGLIAALSVRVADIVPPVTPEGDDARRWAERELSNPAYQAARPTWFDRIAQAIGDVIRDLFSARLPQGVGSTIAIVAAVVVAGLIVAAILVWGLPRTTPRSHAKGGDLFGETETRSAQQLRADAASSAARGEWDAAIVLRFRALARSLAERGIVETPPGATVHAFARTAGRRLPGSAEELDAAAGVFDDVRYLRRPGTRELYQRVSAVDDAVAAARPVTLEGTPA